MIIVDDRGALEVLSGRTLRDAGSSESVATTWGFHYRLVRALADDRIVGSLGASATEAVRSVAARPPADRLVVLDPQELTATAVGVAVRHGLNLLASELTAAAIVHSVPITLSLGNVGSRWPEVFAAEGVAFEVIDF